MIDDFKVIIDNVSLEFFCEPFGGTYSWIVDAHRNQNDFMIITNPIRKRTLELNANYLTKSQFITLASVVGKANICHTVELWDDLSQSLKTYEMYNSDLKYTKKRVGGQTIYDSVSFSLIER